MGVQMNLLAPSGVGLADVRRVLSIPMATAQCRGFLQRELPGVGPWPWVHGRGAPCLVAGDENDGHSAAIAPRWPPRSTASRCWPTTSRTTPTTPPASSSSPARASPRPPATTRRRSSSSSGPTARARCSPSSRSSPPRSINLTKLESRPDQEGAGRLLLRHGPRGPHRRGAGGRLPARPEVQGRRRQVPRLLPAAGEHGPARRREADAAWRDARDWIEQLRREIL